MFIYVYIIICLYIQFPNLYQESRDEAIPHLEGTDEGLVRPRFRMAILGIPSDLTSVLLLK